MNSHGDEGDGLGRAHVMLYNEFTKWQAISISRYVLRTMFVALMLLRKQ